MHNHLKSETSPYLLQHAENPVDWYPWCEEAFARARSENKPIFLSIGYSTCHWCHVMAHESFENEEIAALLNQHFISIKVDKEERPDVDAIYMAVCQAFTGSGGWPTSIFMTADQKPFFAGTYFPPHTRGPMIGLAELLTALHEQWTSNRELLLTQAEQLVSHLKHNDVPVKAGSDPIPDRAAALFKQLYDRTNGGFGQTPKFPTPHNLLFLMAYFQRRNDADCLSMAEHTLIQMYRGGLFDHIGSGFCRYSTDARFLVPHFEKMLYDNALLLLAYCKAYAVTRKPLYLDVAKRTAAYIFREMTAPEGGFYSAQDADSDGEEGKYYLFTPDEIIAVLGPQDGQSFNQRFDITKGGNFEGKNIPNLLQSWESGGDFDLFLPRLVEYRKARCALHLDDKVLTVWNALMIAALCSLYRVSGEEAYLAAAQKADRFLREHLMQGDTLFVSFRAGTRGQPGFLDDYAAYLFAQLSLYAATLEEGYLTQAEALCQTVLTKFQDPEGGGFYFSGPDSETLILRPKETYDGAVPSGNSLMAWNLVRLSLLTGKDCYAREAQRQVDYLSAQAAPFPPGHAMFLLALLDWEDPPAKITVVPAGAVDRAYFVRSLPLDAAVTVLDGPTPEFPLRNEKTTFYVCRGHCCLPPVNDFKDIY